MKSLRVKFRAFSRYGLPTVNVFQVRPRAQGTISILVKCYQKGMLVADALMNANMSPSVSSVQGVTDSPSAEVIRTFLRSLRVDPDHCLAHLGFGYPRAFLAALPPGEMVRLGGEGGLLNVLDLHFPDGAVPSINDEPLPTAVVEPSRPRRQFRKVLARVGTEFQTYCKGYATVLASMVRRGSASPETLVP